MQRAAWWLGWGAGGRWAEGTRGRAPAMRRTGSRGPGASRRPKSTAHLARLEVAETVDLKSSRHAGRKLREGWRCERTCAGGRVTTYVPVRHHALHPRLKRGCRSAAQNVHHGKPRSLLHLRTRGPRYGGAVSLLNVRWLQLLTTSAEPSRDAASGFGQWPALAPSRADRHRPPCRPLCPAAPPFAGGRPFFALLPYTCFSLPLEPRYLCSLGLRDYKSRGS